MFTALLKKCIDRDVVPLCKYIPSKNSPPRFVALLPQEEELDEHKVQIRPPGFHAIFLPFADDFRKVKFQESTKANSEQIDAAKDLIKKLQFTYTPESFENPVLQKHWRNIEALALDRDAPEEMTDYTLPDEGKMKKRAGEAITNFKDLVFPSDYAPGAKRKATTTLDAAAKKAKAENAAAGVDLKTEAEAGRLGKLTVAILREKIKQEGITSAGSKKADLIDAICAHYGVGV